MFTFLHCLSGVVYLVEWAFPPMGVKWSALQAIETLQNGTGDPSQLAKDPATY